MFRDLLNAFARIGEAFWDAWKEDGVRSVAMLATLLTALLMWISGKPVPPELLTLLTLILGYFLGRAVYLTRVPGDGHVEFETWLKKEE